MTKLLIIDLSPVMGGAQQSMLALIQKLQERNYDLFLFSSSDEFCKRAENFGIAVYKSNASMWTKSVKGLMEAGVDTIQFRKWLKDFRATNHVDVFFANGIHAGLLASMSIDSSDKLIFHHRDLLCPQTLLKPVLKRADHTIIISKFLMEELPVEARCTQIYNGSDYDLIVALAAMETIYYDSVTVVLIADMAEWKRHELFIRAFAIACQDSNMDACIIGGPRNEQDAQYFEKLKILVNELKLEKAIHFTGHIENPYPRLKAASLLCSVADNEPFGRTMIEALVLDVPVLSAGGGAAEEILDCDGGRICKDDINSLAMAMCEQISQPVHLTKDWHKRFSIDHHVDQIIEQIQLLDVA